MPFEARQIDSFGFGFTTLIFKLLYKLSGRFYRRIFVYNISLISTSDTVSDGATSTLVMNIYKRHTKINSPKDFEPDELNTGKQYRSHTRKTQNFTNKCLSRISSFATQKFRSV